MLRDLQTAYGKLHNQDMRMPRCHVPHK